MSDIGDTSVCSIFTADYVGVDSISQKVNILGIGSSVLQIVGIDQSNNLVQTVPFAVFANIAVPAKFVNDEYVLSLELRDKSDTPVSLPGASGNEKVRVSQVIKVEPVLGPTGKQITYLPSRFNMNINFPNGLTIKPDENYSWILEIDGEVQTKTEFTAANNQPGAPKIVFG